VKRLPTPRGRKVYVSVLASGAKSADWYVAQRKVPIMPDHDLPPHLRQRHQKGPEVVSLELPLDEDVAPPPVRDPDRSADEERTPEPFLRRS
jgi:hypothetical protein